MLKRGTIAWTIWNIIEATLLIVAGILCLAWSGNSDFQKNAVLVVGIMVIVDAGLRLLLGVIEIFSAGDAVVIRTNTTQAVAGAAELSLGISLCYIFAHYEAEILSDGTIVPAAKNVFGFVGIYIGVLLIVIAAIMMIHSLFYMVRKYNSLAQNIFTLIAGGIALALGIVALLNLNPAKGDNVVQFFLVVAGLIALFLGLFIGLFAILALVAAKKTIKESQVNENQSEEDPIDNEEK